MCALFNRCKWRYQRDVYRVDPTLKAQVCETEFLPILRSGAWPDWVSLKHGERMCIFVPTIVCKNKQSRISLKGLLLSVGYFSSLLQHNLNNWISFTSVQRSTTSGIINKTIPTPPPRLINDNPQQLRVENDERKYNRRCGKPLTIGVLLPSLKNYQPLTRQASQP